MKNITTWLTIICFAMGQQFAIAQGGFFMSGGVRVVCTGAPNIVVENGKWSNTASTFTAGQGKVKFTGTASTANSTIMGANSNFYDLEIAKPANDVQLVATTTVSNYLTFTNGKLDLSTKTLVLANPNGKLMNESEANRTIGGTNGRAMKTSNISNVNNLNLGNLGLSFTLAGNLGSTVVSRFHPAQALPTVSGITKYWNVTAATPAGQDATLRFYYFDAELNGNSEATLVIWRSTNNGASWTEMGYTTRSSTSNYVEKTGITDVSGRWTLGTTATPLLPPSIEGRIAEGMEDPASDLSSWSVYPNPASTQAIFHIRSSTNLLAELEVFDLTGKVIFTEEVVLEKGKNTIPIGVSDWPSGTYIANLTKFGLKPLPFIKY